MSPMPTIPHAQESTPPPEQSVTLTDWIAYAYLMRVPILIGVFLFLFPILAVTSFRPLLQNLFVLDVEGTIWTTAMALALCWSLLLTSRLVRLNGERFGLRQALKINTLKTRSTFIAWLLALPLVLIQFILRDEFRLDGNALLWRLGGVLVGALVAYLFAFTGVFLTTLAAPPGNAPADTSFPAFPPLDSLLKFANHHGIDESKIRPFGSLLKRLPQGLWVGYLDPSNGLLWSGHWLAFTFAVSIGALTLLLDYYHRLAAAGSSPIPALCYLMILLMNLNWILAFLAFLLDRYRVPLFLPIAIVCALGARSPLSDHYYSSATLASKSPAPTPYDVLTARRGKPIIVVATAGGGIQAGAWTDQVLSGLEELSKQWGTPYRFHECLTLVSSVSGGATGSMYFLNLYGPGPDATFQEQKIPAMQDAVEQSSLNDIGWALAFRDFTRISVPYFDYFSTNKLLDRGYMLEQTWRQRGRINAELADWRAGVKEGLRPAVIFNSTIAETGEPLLLSTTGLHEKPSLPNAHDFYDLYPAKDLPVVTAVRLAATFPYATPAARIVPTKHEAAYHMIDGGYYDNPGISSLVTWIDEGLEDLAKNAAKVDSSGTANQKTALDPLPEHILIIQIRSFPDEGTDPAPVDRGWFFQAYAPIKGLLSVRTSAQLIRDHRELQGLARIWHTAPGQGSLQDRIRFATFTFNGNDAPLSWAMSQKQKEAITYRWNKLPETNEKDLKWVHCTLDPSFAACNTSELNGPY